MRIDPHCTALYNGQSRCGLHGGGPDKVRGTARTVIMTPFPKLMLGPPVDFGFHGQPAWTHD